MKLSFSGTSIRLGNHAVGLCGFGVARTAADTHTEERSLVSESAGLYNEVPQQSRCQRIYRFPGIALHHGL